jgi:hypothetical protein
MINARILAAVSVAVVTGLAIALQAAFNGRAGSVIGPHPNGTPCERLRRRNRRDSYRYRYSDRSFRDRCVGSPSTIGHAAGHRRRYTRDNYHHRYLVLRCQYRRNCRSRGGNDKSVGGRNGARSKRDRSRCRDRPAADSWGTRDGGRGVASVTATRVTSTPEHPWFCRRS